MDDLYAAASEVEHDPDVVPRGRRGVPLRAGLERAIRTGPRLSR
ncbi:MAG TPA: hypothetical protein VGP05_15900 [Pseudonocardia sp.]|nr:hypothetical protein [Pseudonocardia sp.]